MTDWSEKAISELILCATVFECKNEFDLHENKPVVGTHFHMNGFKDLQRSSEMLLKYFANIFEELKGSLPISLQNLSSEDLCKLFQ